MHLTESEERERNRLIQLQSDHTRWFSREEFNRLQELTKKYFEGEDPNQCDHLTTTGRSAYKYSFYAGCYVCTKCNA